ncbi:serine/threonine-protein kinase-like protein CCR2 [Ricinus communis]|uniref:non-specific serine/threonine protein kinase n=1 Tax=Ricinus communis TaxID=3988 RepID=B9SU97_RICCO|nr:serine/threonine-protein kinase-like protein CCR2 [Ricinus communis]EEF32800.1 ATP binding protein, putative [Ricinus communis]|eukprot:XP_002529566.1 serine/threonine-protein kinase-like protein CCR2 [Ricinus communis]
MLLQRSCLSGSPLFFLISLLLLLPITAFGYGSSGPIAAAFGQNGFFCAIDAGGKQAIICWNKNDNSSVPTATAYFSSLPPMASLSGGEGFLCGITSNSSQAFCFSLLTPGTDLVPTSFKSNSYSQIAVGKYHACAIKGSYFSSIEYGNINCWEFNQTFNSFRNSNVDSLILRRIVSGDGFSCGVTNKEGGVICWGPRSANLEVPASFGDFETLASSRNSVCGIRNASREVECWGDANDYGAPLSGTRFVDITAGAHHFCGIREDNHGVECWGNVDLSSVPKGSGFLAIASSDYTTCGVREVDLVLDCWDVHGKSLMDYSPPLQLCSPGVCSLGSCPTGKFAFNASLLNEPELTNLCVRKDLKICLPCGTNCSQGYFPSSTCSENADRICTACSLCQNSSCWDVCGLPSSSGFKQQDQQIKKLVIIIGPSLVSVLLLVLIGWCLFPQKAKDEESRKQRCSCCLAKPVVEADPDPNPQLPLSITTIGETQVFRLSELKDATHGFKEFNELGRGSFGFVYKAVLPDGRQIAVKRANAATIIHTNSREFEAELEILCSIRHSNIVNLLGYCAEMGERLLVYELMPHGTLHDHLHGELSPLDWNFRLKISLQAARGLEYLHNEVKPPIVHRDVKTSNILLDSEWGARIADFGLLSSNDKDVNGDMVSDVYNFGVVLLEILSGRKAYDRDYNPPSIVEWALPLLRMGRAAAIIDRNVALPRNVEPLLKLADVAELTLRENPSQRPSMSSVANMLDQIVKIGLTL